MSEWHQSAWQYLNHLEEIKKGANCEHRKKLTTDVDAVDVPHDVPARRDGMAMSKDEYDGYGTALRERMKRSVEKPAGEWHPLNRKQNDLPVFIAIYVTILVSMILGAGYLIYALWLRLGR